MVMFDHRYTPRSPTCAVAKNIPVGDKVILLTGISNIKQSTNLNNKKIRTALVMTYNYSSDNIIENMTIKHEQLLTITIPFNSGA
jgi:hypothetical protein